MNMTAYIRETPNAQARSRNQKIGRLVFSPTAPEKRGVGLFGENSLLQCVD